MIFFVRTSHQSLRWIPDKQTSTGRFADRRLRLVEFEFETQRRPGIKHMRVDALFRLPNVHSVNCDIEGDIQAYRKADDHVTTNQKVEVVVSPTVQSILSAQRHDAYCCLIVENPYAPTFHTYMT